LVAHLLGAPTGFDAQDMFGQNMFTSLMEKSKPAPSDKMRRAAGPSDANSQAYFASGDAKEHTQLFL
jgi:hypothetical protein